LAPASKAALIIDVSEAGGDVVITASGVLNFAPTSGGSSSTVSMVWPTSPYGSIILVGSTSAANVDSYSGISGPSSFGAGPMVVATSGSGDTVGVIGNAAIYVPEGYSFGNPLSGTATFTGASFVSLGLTPGSYLYTWGAGPTAESLTVNVGVAAVPEPSTAVLVGFVIAGLAFRASRRRYTGA
jgi:hypothetical protein